MAKDIEYRVDVDARDGVREFDKLGKAGKEAGQDIERSMEKAGTSSSKALQRLGQMAGKLETEIDGTKKAAKALATELEKLDSDVDATRAVGELRKLGAEFDDIETDAKEFAEQLERISKLKVDAGNMGLANVGSSARNAKGGLDEMRDSGDQSRSVLANLAGNTAQDLGEVGGAVGSLGVGLGQLAEYAVDGNIALSNLAAVAGPMLALTAVGVGFQMLTSAMGKNKAEAESLANAYTAFSDALGESVGSLDEWNEGIQALFEAGKGNPFDVMAKDFISAVEAMDDGEKKADDLRKGLSDLNMTTSEYVQGLAEAGGSFRSWAEAQLRAAGATDEQAKSIAAAVDETENWSDLISSDLLILPPEAEQAMSDFLATNKDLIEGLEQVDDTVGSMNLEDMAEAFLSSQRAIEGETAIVDKAVDSTDSWSDALVRYLELKRQQNAAEEETARRSEQINAANERYVEDVNESIRLQQERIDLLNEEAEAQRETTYALAQFAAEFDGAAVRAESFARALEEVNERADLSEFEEISGVLDPLEELHQALHDLKETGTDLAATDFVPDSWNEVKNMPEELRPVVEAFKGLREGVQAEMTEAFAHGGGRELTQWATDMRNGIVAEIQAMGFDVDEEAAIIKQTLTELGLTDVQIDAVIKASGEDQVRGVIDQVMSAIGDVPPEVALAVALQMDEDPLGALRTLLTATDTEVPITLLPVLDQMEEAITGIVDEDNTVSFLADDGGTIDELSTDADTAAEPRTVQVFVPKSDSLGAMGALIDEVAKPREVQFSAKSDSLGAVGEMIAGVAAGPYDADIVAHGVGISGVAHDLDWLAEERDTDVVAHGKKISDVDSDLDDLADDRDTDVIAHGKGIAGVDSDLNWLARDRDMDVVAHGSGISGVDSDLNWLARDRSADVTAQGHGIAGVDSDLEWLARDRFADIYVRTHGTASASGAIASTGARSATAPVAAMSAFGAEAPAPVAAATPSAASSVAVLAAPAPVVPVIVSPQVTINAGVIGNRFAVQRAVSQAMRSALRLGSRR